MILVYGQYGVNRTVEKMKKHMKFVIKVILNASD